MNIRKCDAINYWPFCLDFKITSIRKRDWQENNDIYITIVFYILWCLCTYIVIWNDWPSIQSTAWIILLRILIGICNYRGWYYLLPPQIKRNHRPDRHRFIIIEHDSTSFLSEMVNNHICFCMYWQVFHKTLTAFMSCYLKINCKYQGLQL